MYDIGILGGMGPKATKIYDRYNAYGLTLCYPSEEVCREIHHIIYDVKQENKPMQELAQKLSDLMAAISREDRIM